MAAFDPAELRRRKERIRQQARLARRGQQQKDVLSRLICQRLATLPEYQAARTVLFYVSMPDEVGTHESLIAAMEEAKRVLVPYCEENMLKLFPLSRMDELAEGTMRILEPRAELRRESGRQVEIGEVDLVVAPGVAFDREGGRIGHGKGYYDRLLADARSDTLLVGLAFECQMVPEVPTGPDDILLDRVVTEEEVYVGRRHVHKEKP